MQVDSAVEEIVVEETKCTLQCESLTATRIIRTNKQTAVIVYSCENKCVPTVWRAFTGCRKTKQFTKFDFHERKKQLEKNSGCEKFSPLTFFVPFFVFVTAKQNCICISSVPFTCHSYVNRNESVLTCHVPLHTPLLNFQKINPTTRQLSFFFRAYPVSPFGSH